MTEEEICVGVIGGGRIGKLHVENIVKNFSNVKIKYLADIKTDHLEEWAKEMGIIKLTTDTSEIFEDAEVNAVLIFSSTDTHIKFIKQAAKAGKDIFCEKPIGSDIENIKEGLEIVEQNGVKLMIGFNRRFDHNFRRVRKAVDDGIVGDPHIIKITSRDPAPPPLDYVKVSGGLFFDMTIHDWDMARYLANSEVKEVYATGQVLISDEIKGIDIDTAVAILKYKDGSMCTIDNSRKAVYGYDQRIEVFGSKGATMAENDTPNNVVIYTDEATKRDKMHHFFLERYTQSYIDEMKEFLKCIEEDIEPPVTGKDGLKAVQIAMAAQKSLEENEPVELSEFE